MVTGKTLFKVIFEVKVNDIQNTYSFIGSYRRYKLTNDEAQVPSVDFEGGFKVPNVIWQKLYRYVKPVSLF